jgi:two-component system CheB/CheR fusion protein
MAHAGAHMGNDPEPVPGPLTISPPQAELLPHDAPDELRPRVPFSIVGIGASAGGLEAFIQLFRALPSDTGLGFVLVQHLAPSHPSALPEILARATRMPVLEVHDESRVQPNHVYVIPPGWTMTIAQGALHLLAREAHGQPRPIDRFFQSLADDQAHQAIGVVLSGSATDGTLGLEAIKARSGITFAQDETAQHSSMPRSAITAGCVDFVLPPDEIAGEIARGRSRASLGTRTWRPHPR